jgi:ribosomal protein L35AE/L33A
MRSSMGNQDSNSRNIGTNLGVFLCDPVEDGSVCACRVAALHSRFGIVFIAFSQTLRAKVVGIAKRLVNTLECLVTGHEDLNVL